MILSTSFPYNHTQISEIYTDAFKPDHGVGFELSTTVNQSTIQHVMFPAKTNVL